MAESHTSVRFGERCAAMGIQPSMGTVGDGFDHAMVESFFATLECELLAQQRFRTHEEVKLPRFGGSSEKLVKQEPK